MLRREKINEITNLSEGFLSDRWDNALLGYAEHATEGSMITVPCYGYQALKAILQYKSPEQVYRELNTILSNPYAFVVHKLNNKQLWKLIYELKLPRWELLDNSIVGLLYNRCSIAGVCFNKATISNTINDTHAMTEDTIFKQAAHTSVMLETNIIPVYLGEQSPWYLTPIQ